MTEKEFNLLEEPWILVMGLDGKVEEKSLLEVLVHSHEYRCLAGELPTQDFAIMRLLLAVLQTIVYRYDEERGENPIEDEKDAFTRWKAIWDAGHFPESLIQEYLDEWKERFWLFHPERPFYQVPEAAIGTEYTSAKLNGAISESNHKMRLFAERSGLNKNYLTYAEAARWLVYLNGFSDSNSVKKVDKSTPTISTGWLGQLGIIYAQGETLFETLMLNLVLLDKQGECWSEPKPVWELETVRSEERTEIAMPDNQTELLTLQSRRMLLKRDEDAVTGCTILGGDFFSKSNAENEQMTLWETKSKKNEAPEILPKQNTTERQIWRDFSCLMLPGEQNIRPGVVNWVETLKRRRMLNQKKMVCFRTASVQYDGNVASVVEIYDDSIEFCTSIFTELGKFWSGLIQEEIKNCVKAANAVKEYARKLKLAGGGSEANADAKAEMIAEQYYDQLNVPFREWLLSIDPDADPDPNKVQAEWRIQGYRIAVELGKDILSQSNNVAFTGRKYIADKKIKTEQYLATPELFNQYLNSLGKYFEIEKAKEILSQG